MTLLQFIFIFVAIAFFTWLHPDWAFLVYFALLSRWFWKWTA